MILESEKLRTAFSIVDQVPVESTVLSSRFIRLSAGDGSLRMTLNGLVYGDASVAGEKGKGEAWQFLVDRKAFAGYLSQAGKTVELLHSAEGLAFKSGANHKMRVQAPAVEVSGYGKWPVTERSKLVFSHEELALLSQYCAKGLGGEKFAAIRLVPKLGAMATDSVALVFVGNPKCESSILIPPLVAAACARFAAEQLLVGKNGVGLSTAVGRLYQMWSSKLEDYPTAAFKDLLEKAQTAPTAFTCAAGVLSEFLNEIDHFGRAVEAATVGATVQDGKHLEMLLTFAGGELRRSLVVEGAKALLPTVNWKLGPVVAWFRYVGRLEGATVCCRRLDKAKGPTAFLCQVKGGQRLALLLADA